LHDEALVLLKRGKGEENSKVHSSLENPDIMEERRTKGFENPFNIPNHMSKFEMESSLYVQI
jgi:hypothetical protein